MQRTLFACAVTACLMSATLAAAASDPAATAAAPSPPNPPAAAAQPAAPADGAGKMICKSEPVTGSRLEVVKKCFTKSEWADIQRRDQDGLNTAQTNASYMGPQGH